MEGRIQVESESGKGTCFSFTVPLQIADNQPTQWLDLPTPTFSGQSILLLISNPALGRAIRRPLQFLGLHTLSLSLEHFCAAGFLQPSEPTEQYERLLTDDAALDRLDTEAQERLKQLISTLPKPPVLLTYPVRGGYERFLPAGIEPVMLNKPLTMKALMQALNCEGKCKIGTGTVPCQAEKKTEEKTEAAEPVEQGTLRVLAADDNRGNQMLIRTFLKKFGLSVDIVDNGSEALQKMRETAYDVIFMDVNMPIMDGLEATRRIREEIASDRQPWIVAITANVAAEDRQRCTDAGMNDFLEKPFAKAAFERVLATVREH
jgi:CheY-like chemotaxis protein